MKLPSALLLLFFFTCSSVAQITISKGQRDLRSYANPDNGTKCITMLRQGTLIVRLSSFSQKIQHLESSKGNEAAAIEKERIETANKNIIREFKDDYHFSDVVFTYGKELDQFLKNNIEHAFLNEDLEFDSSIKIKDGPVYILATKSTTVFKLCDVNFIPIVDPSIEFTSYHLDVDYRGVNAFAQGFRELVRSKSTKKLNDKLDRFARSAH